MTPGIIWETILELKRFTFRELYFACLKKLSYHNPATEKMLKYKIKYILKRATQEGRLLRYGKRYETLLTYEARKKLKDAPPEVSNVVNKLIDKLTREVLIESVKKSEKSA